jgi:hypothetical protein
MGGYLSLKLVGQFAIHMTFQLWSIMLCTLMVI